MQAYVFPVLIALTFEGCQGCSPVEPSTFTSSTTPIVATGVWTCERFLTHPIRMEYLRRCTHSTTGEIEIRPDCDTVSSSVLINQCANR